MHRFLLSVRANSPDATTDAAMKEYQEETPGAPMTWCSVANSEETDHVQQIDEVAINVRICHRLHSCPDRCAESMVLFRQADQEAWLGSQN